MPVLSYTVYYDPSEEKTVVCGLGIKVDGSVPNAVLEMPVKAAMLSLAFAGKKLPKDKIELDAGKLAVIREIRRLDIPVSLARSMDGDNAIQADTEQSKESLSRACYGLFKRITSLDQTAEVDADMLAEFHILYEEYVRHLGISKTEINNIVSEERKHEGAVLKGKYNIIQAKGELITAQMRLENCRLWSDDNFIYVHAGRKYYRYSKDTNDPPILHCITVTEFHEKIKDVGSSFSVGNPVSYFTRNGIRPIFL